MPLFPVKLAPGLYMNSTEHSRKGRWADGERVRWHNDALEPIGGWQRMTDYSDTYIDALTATPADETFRDGTSWLDNTGGRRYIFGSNDGLVILKTDETIENVTPAGFVGSDNDPSTNTGYGSWIYGGHSYGTARPIDPDAVGDVFRWNFDTWGEDLIAGAANPGFRDTLYLYDTSASPSAMTEITEAPDDINGFVVTDQRIIMTIGSDTESRVVKWCDRENYTDWTSTATNWAGSYFLQGAGQLTSIKKVLNQILIISEKDAHVARFIGPPYIYGFDRVGENCGAWSGQSVYVTDRFAMWPGRRTFWMYDGTLRPVECDIQDFLDNDVNHAQASKFWCMGVPSYNEIWWFYQSNGGTSVDSYVSFDYIKQVWSKGRLSRTGGVDGESARNPIMIDGATQALYEHELEGVNTPGASAKTGPMEVGMGDVNMAVQYIYPDSEDRGDAQYILRGKQFPTGSEVVAGPYGHTGEPIPTRIMAREITLEVDGNDDARWRVGHGIRLDIPTNKTGKR